MGHATPMGVEQPEWSISYKYLTPLESDKKVNSYKITLAQIATPLTEINDG